jgi:hypothetical protein
MEKYRKAEYKAAHIWHSRHDFSTLVTLNVHTADSDLCRRWNTKKKKEGKVWISSGIGQQLLGSAIQRIRVRSEHDVVDFFKAKPAFSGDKVVGWRPAKDLAPGLVVLVVLLQAPDVFTEPGIVLTAYVSKITLMLVPSFLECVACKSSIMLYPFYTI